MAVRQLECARSRACLDGDASGSIARGTAPPDLLLTWRNHASCCDGRTTGGELCDDGNTADFDGCSSACQFEISEVEPNDDGSPSLGGSGTNGNDFSTADLGAFGDVRNSFSIFGSLSTPGDEDVYSFKPASNVVSTHVTVELWDRFAGIGAPCTAIDPVATLRDAAGNALAVSDNVNGLCPTLSFALAPFQQVFLHITDFDDNNVIPGYVLVTTVTK